MKNTLKRILKLSSIIFLTLIIFALAMPYVVNGAGTPTYPTSINGLPVIYIQTPENTFGLSSGQIVLTLLDTKSTTVYESVNGLNMSKYLAANPLPAGWSIEVYGGPNASKELFLQAHQINYNIDKMVGPIRLGPIASKSLATARPMLTGNPTYAVVADNDPAHYTIDDIKAIWTSPTLGTSQNSYSALLLNAYTDYSYFMQCGQIYFSGSNGAENAWADTSSGNSATAFNISYNAGHEMAFIILRDSDTSWSMCCSDRTASLFDYKTQNYSTIGGHLVSSPNTSVWFENFSTNSNWYQNFTNPLSAYSAQDGYRYTYNSWGYQNIYILDSYGNYQSNNNIITGALTSGQTAYWHLDKILLAQ
jgi:hypothetical protein